MKSPIRPATQKCTSVPQIPTERIASSTSECVGGGRGPRRRGEGGREGGTKRIGGEEGESKRRGGMAREKEREGKEGW